MLANRTKRTIALIFIALSVTNIALRAQDSSMREVGRRDWAASMPEGEGKGLVLANCTQCHSLNSTVLQRKTAEQWDHTVRDMVTRGAQLLPQEVPIIAAYLAKSFPPGAPVPGVDAPSGTRTVKAGVDPTSPDALPAGAARSIILRACVDCHGLERITLRAKDEHGWRANVKDMVRLGATLKPAEEPAVVAYLVENFSRPAATTASVGSLPAAGPADPASLLPDGEGKGLVLGTCIQCHALRTVTAQHKDAANWKRTVHDMVARGAQLTWSEAELAAAYLATALPKK